MTKRTKKAGIVGKYGTRYGASLRKQIKKMEVSQHAKYFCEFCGKLIHSFLIGYTVCSEKKSSWDLGLQGLRQGQGRWCLYIEVSLTASAVTVRSTIRRLREQTES
ncbi:hypothetical protein ZIOFF_042275 [Zingiber officinale]|uniref:60S ribosomal protein L37a n=1 Tax=Zingiber officinale TaxID=94328 RepID=A0A8J5G881_ZINOF|nr:hypothetical protein ZIOFF_042275 [Zingiber officinale]